MTELLAVATITLLAVISPGPDFAMVSRNSYAFGRRSGLLTALGIGCAVQLHVLYTVLGVAVLITRSPTLFLLVKLVGAGYLVWLGVASLRRRAPLTVEGAQGSQPGALKAFAIGFMTNALNPKTLLFVVATYSQVVQVGQGLALSFGYGLFMSAAHWLWFSLVALLFSNPALRQRLLARQRLLDRAIGSALIGLGVALLLPGLTG